MRALAGTTALPPTPCGLTNTAYFHDHIYQQPCVEVSFIRGRLRFGGSKKDAPFPSMVVIFRPRWYARLLFLRPRGCSSPMECQARTGRCKIRHNGRRGTCRGYVPATDDQRPANGLIGRIGRKARR